MPPVGAQAHRSRSDRSRRVLFPLRVTLGNPKDAGDVVENGVRGRCCSECGLGGCCDRKDARWRRQRPATSEAGRESLGRVEELAAEGSVCADGDCGGGGLGLASVPAAVWASEKSDTGNSSCHSYNKHERGCKYRTAPAKDRD